MKCLIIIVASLLIWSEAIAQIPVEVLGGRKKNTFDVMFFRFIKNDLEENSKFLFFNRNRVSIDYNLTSSQNLPQFGFTEALSYYDTRLKGFAPVAVTQISNHGVFPKAGLQYALSVNNITLFTWLVSELGKSPILDFFLLFRFTPMLSDKANLFVQVESFNGIPTERENFLLVERLRLGIKMNTWQYGLGGDFSQQGRDQLIHTNNMGVFLRHEF